MRIRLALVIVALLAACGQSDTADAPEAGSPAAGEEGGEAVSETVTIQELAYDPATLTVSSGTTVQWDNADDPSHTVTFEDGEDSGTLASGDSYDRTFDQAGDYPYSCTVHPSMTGSVTVE